MARPLDDVALFRHLPALVGQVPWQRLGDWPTPVEEACSRPAEPGADAAAEVSRGLFVVGREISSVRLWVPQFGRVGLG